MFNSVDLFVCTRKTNILVAVPLKNKFAARVRNRSRPAPPLCSLARVSFFLLPPLSRRHAPAPNSFHNMSSLLGTRTTPGNATGVKRGGLRERRAKVSDVLIRLRVTVLQLFVRYSIVVAALVFVWS